MTVANAQDFARFKWLLVQLASLSAILMLTACGLSKQEASTLLPPTVVAEGKLRAQAEALTRKTNPEKAVNCPPTGVPAVSAGGPLETGSIPKTAPPVQTALTTPAAAPGKPPGPEQLYIDFQPGSATLSDREKLSVKEAVGARILSGEVRVRIAAARGGTGNFFESATIADKRARFVNAILPTKMVESVEFDPTLPEDTVRLEFYRPQKRTN